MISTTVLKLFKNKAVQNILAVCLWLLVWHTVSLYVDSSILLVSPLEVLKTLSTLVFTQDFWTTAASSSVRIILGFLLGMAAGVVLASISSASGFIRVLLQPFMLTVRSVPVASFIILALLWLKSASNLAVFISFLMVLPIIYQNTLTGIMTADKELLEMAQVFRVPLVRRIRYIYMPNAAPQYAAACRTSLGLCWKSGIAAEVIGITRGSIGEALYNAKLFFSTAELFAWTLVIVLLSLSFEKLFMYGVDRLVERVSGGSAEC